MHASIKPIASYCTCNYACCALLDSAINRKVLSSVLRKVGCRDIDEASDGVEALQAVQVGHYDLVFMDNTMPNMVSE